MAQDPRREPEIPVFHGGEPEKSLDVAELLHGIRNRLTEVDAGATMGLMCTYDALNDRIRVGTAVTAPVPGHGGWALCPFG
jgi:hypothetical protein